MAGIFQDRSFIDFNKELFFAEVGATLGTPLFAFLVSRFSHNVSTISASAVLGGIFGSAVLWIVTRVYDKNKTRRYSVKNFANDVLYFTPVAFLVSVLFYYPTIFFLSRHFIRLDHRVFTSVVFSQLIAFCLFVTFMNIYRYLLYTKTGKEL
ncbi:MAG: hypothetical protein AABW63_02015 [Nanoarchaeota archaeon]